MQLQRAVSSALGVDEAPPEFVTDLLDKLPLSGTFDGDKFFTAGPDGQQATQLTATLICIAICDVVFAVDSIPAVLAINNDPFVIFTSNAAAVLGLRSLYQLLSVAVSDLVYLEKAVALVLGFVGAKLAFEFVGYEVSTIQGGKLDPEVIELEGTLDSIEKGGYSHFMLKEIMEQPASLENCMRGRVKLHSSAPPSPARSSRDGGSLDDESLPRDSPHITLGVIEQVLYKDGQEMETLLSRLQRARRIIICGCGTSWHAGLVGEYIFEQLCRVPVEVEYADRKSVV